MKIFSVPVVVFAGLATSMAANSCEDRPVVQIVKPFETKPVNLNVKETIDAKREAIEKKERAFAKELVRWTSDLTRVLPDLSMVSNDKKNCLKAKEAADEITKQDKEFRKLTKADFSIKKPNEKQVEAFTKLINTAVAARDPFVSFHTGHMTLSGLGSKIEEKLQQQIPPLQGEEFKKEKERYLGHFKQYKETFKRMQSQFMDVRMEINNFNEEAKKANEPVYQSVWGLNSERLARLLGTFALRLQKE